MIYSNARNVYISYINKANKNNSVCKKGESYIRVKEHKYGSFKLFKTLEELDKKYPRILRISEPELRIILSDFKESNQEAKEFLVKYFKL